MTASEQMRAMVDQLMGTEYNERDTANSVRFTDSRVCKPFLLNCCAHEVFEFTRMNLGACYRIHDIRLRTDFEKSQVNRDHGYDLEVKNYLKSFLSDRDRRTAIAKQKLEEAQEKSKNQLSEKEAVVEKLNIQIEAKMAEAERLGEEGLIDDCLKATQELEELNLKKYEAEQECRTALPSLQYQQQKMRVCEVCTSLLGVQDNDRRLADHFGGKLHGGFIFLQEKFDQLQEKLKKKLEQERSTTESSSGQEDAGYNRPIRSRERRHGHKRERSRDRSRRSYRSRSRSRNHNRRSRSPQSNWRSKRYKK